MLGYFLYPCMYPWLSRVFCSNKLLERWLISMGQCTTFYVPEEINSVFILYLYLKDESAQVEGHFHLNNADK